MELKIAVSSTHKEFRPYGDILAQRGYSINYMDGLMDGEQSLIKTMAGYNAIIAFGEYFTKTVFAALKWRLKLICRFGLGYEKVDLAAAAAGVCVTNTAGTMADSVAELSVLLMLECCRRVAKQDGKMQKGIWELGFQGSQLSGKTVGLIGFGNISQRLARICRGFGCDVIAYDIAFNETAAAQIGVAKAALDEIASKSDFISMNVPLSPSSRHMVDGNFLRKMKKSAYLVNTSRGPTVDEQALIAALDNGVIAGAALDVFETEPLEAESRLRGRDNVILTPHYASFTREAYMETITDIAETLDAFSSGAVPKHCLDPDYVNNYSNNKANQ